jgi:hypothetical protein
VIPKLVARGRRNSNALSGEQMNPLTIGFIVAWKDKMKKNC